MRQIGKIDIYRDEEGMLWLKLGLDEPTNTLNHFEGIEGSGGTLAEALEDIFISVDTIGE